MWFCNITRIARPMASSGATEMMGAVITSLTCMAASVYERLSMPSAAAFRIERSQTASNFSVDSAPPAGIDRNQSGDT
jgi:hypothetical protein